MSNRRKLLFKINNEVVVEEPLELTIDQVIALKWIIAQECDCAFDEIEVEVEDLPIEISEDVDVTDMGMVFWKTLSFDPIQGVECQLEVGSDEYLDAMLDGTLEKHLNFFID